MKIECAGVKDEGSRTKGTGIVTLPKCFAAHGTESGSLNRCDPGLNGGMTPERYKGSATPAHFNSNQETTDED